MSNVELIYPIEQSSKDCSEDSKIPGNPFLMKRWFSAINICSVVSFQGKSISNAPYHLMMNSPNEELMYSSSFNNLSHDYYYVIVRYGRYARFEPRLIKAGFNLKTTDIKINSKNALWNVIIINHDDLNILSKYPKSITKFTELDKIHILFNSEQKDTAITLLQKNNDNKEFIDIDIAHFLGKYYNIQNRRQESLNLLNKNLKLDEVFIYESLIQTIFEKSVSLLYLSYQEPHKYKISAIQFIDSLYISRFLAKPGRDHFFNNIFRFYLGTPISFKRLTRFTLPTYWNYTVMNSSIIRVHNKFYMTLRTVNYIHVTPSYISNDADRHIRTETYFCEMDSDFNLVKHYRIVNKVDYIKYRQTHVNCIEDLRLFYYNDTFWVIGTGIDTHYQQTHQMVIGRLNINHHTKEAIIDKLFILEYGSWRCQKNWIPLVTKNKDNKDELQIIYKYEPFTLLSIDLDSENPHIKLKREIQQPIYCGSFRGSSIPFRYNDKWVMLVHCSRWFNKENTYIHRFIEFDDDLIITRVSNMFRTAQHHMEYVMGAVHDPSTNEIYISLSENDSKGGIAAIDVSTFEDMLYKPEELLYGKLNL